MRSSTQFTAVAEVQVQSQLPLPCRCSITCFIIGNWTWGGLGTVMLIFPSLVMTRIG